MTVLHSLEVVSHFRLIWYSARLLQIIESLNILSWKGLSGIVSSNYWLHIGPPKNQTPCLTALLNVVD